MNEKYAVVFKGDLEQGKTIQEVKNNLKRAKLSKSVFDKMFNKQEKSYVLAQKISYEKALQVQNRFKLFGVKVKILKIKTSIPNEIKKNTEIQSKIDKNSNEFKKMREAFLKDGMKQSVSYEANANNANNNTEIQFNSNKNTDNSINKSTGIQWKINKNSGEFKTIRDKFLKEGGDLIQKYGGMHKQKKSNLISKIGSWF